MALTFPKTNLIQPLKLRDGAVDPMWRQETSTTSGGSSLLKDLGPMLWRASYQTVAMDRSAALDLETDLMTLRGGINLFEGYDPRRADPAQAGVADLSAVTVHSIRADRTALRLAGLPVGFVTSKSDYLSIDDGVNLHLLRVALGGVADAGGVSAWLEILPFVRPSIVPGQPVVMREACARFMIEKESLSRQRVSQVHDAISFTALQVLL
jgi:hypothetical protein